MKRIVLLLSVCVLLAGSAVQAQTSYPMVMSIKPVAAQTGQSSEHEINSRYSLFGAYQVLVSGEGVTGEVVTPMEIKEGQPPPNLTKLQVRFTVDSDALPGVRDVRIATPQGVSTLGQLVIAEDPVVVEAEKNDTPETAQEISVPATVCGSIERAEDVDFYRFRVEERTALTFHVRSMRLQDKIHDLQQHVDPIISLRTAAGATLAASDNVFAADPLLSYRFERSGEYLLEIRDVRYQGNQFWEYSIEISDRPFVTGVHPLGVTAGEEVKLELIGVNLPQERTVSWQVPDDLPPGPQSVRLPLGDGLSNPVRVVVSDLPLTVESDADNDSPAIAQAVTLPAAISGRIEQEADLDCFAFEAKKDERFTFEVVARRQQSELDPVLRILNDQGRQLIENDDAPFGRLTSADSRIENWTAPADGRYVLEVRDLHLRGGDGFVYLLKASRAEPHFELRADTDKTQLTPGTAGVIFVRAVRKNGFAGEIQLTIEGLPDGVTAHCGRILAGKGQDGCIVLEAAPDADLSVANVTITGRAVHPQDDAEPLELHAVAEPGQETYMPGGGRSHWPVEMHTVAVGAPSDLRKIELSTNEVTLKPGESVKIDITIERAEGFDKNVTLDLLFRHLNSVYADALPEGVTIDARNSQTLLTAKQTQGHITLTAAQDAPAVENQQVAVMANISLNFVMKATYSSRPLTVTVVESE